MIRGRRSMVSAEWCKKVSFERYHVRKEGRWLFMRLVELVWLNKLFAKNVFCGLKKNQLITSWKWGTLYYWISNTCTIRMFIICSPKTPLQLVQIIIHQPLLCTIHHFRAFWPQALNHCNTLMTLSPSGLQVPSNNQHQTKLKIFWLHFQ